MNHEEKVREIVSTVNISGYLKHRESNTVEFKQSFHENHKAKYAKTIAAFANNRGGYIIFGVKDSPRKVVGIPENNFENLEQERFTDNLNSLFAPSLEWECGSFAIESDSETKFIGWIYAEEAEHKPVIAQKSENGEKISSGDVYYRYRARNEKIKFAEISHILEERANKELKRMLELLKAIHASGTANLGIINYGNGKFTTPNGVDVILERKLVAKVLKKAKYIKEGSFNETKGIPVIKVTGNIDLAEEVPVPDIVPDEGYPYMQKALAEQLHILPQDLYALIWHYKMKEAQKFHIEITTSKSGKTHKFSKFAFQFLEEKLKELRNNETEFDRIRLAYRNRRKQQGA
ncbi:MAG: ATP-binding protein [Campylobacteraceae bacterium]|jgi:hypothetical protein|nr:ATP-binding protein [Campylobacteraceae bacterium]